MIKILLIGTGGFIGSVMRYFLSGFVHRFIFAESSFPYGTLSVNLFGCLLIGFFSGLVEIRQLFTPEIRLFIFIGLLGGFTTFSSFGYETFVLARGGQMIAAFSNMLLHLTLGLAAVWFGHALAQIS